jgi:hypothetical protein
VADQALWSIRVDEGVSVSVWPNDGRRAYRVRVTVGEVPHDKVVTRERLRKLWLAVRGEVEPVPAVADRG